MKLVILKLLLISFSVVANDFSYDVDNEGAVAMKALLSNSTLFQGSDWHRNLDPGQDINASCDQYVEVSYNGSGFTRRRGNYNLTSSQRASLVQELIAEGRRLGRPPERAGTTTMFLNGRTYDVMNDAVTLADGTYINLTFQESKDLARAYGCRLPNRFEAQAIRRFAEEGRDGSMAVNAITRTNDSPGMRAMNAMMNDSTLHEYARRGQDSLINGHFKWYIDDGSNSFRFYGYRVTPNCYGASSTAYCQNGGSGGHGNHHIDYSQSARFICPQGVRL